MIEFNKVSYEDVKPIFKCYKYWCNDEEDYWYENMWQILDRKGQLTYENDEQYYEVLFKAAALVFIFTDHITIKYGDIDLHDYLYSNVLSEMVSKINLGALYYKYSDTLVEDDESYDDIAEFIANVFRDPVCTAIKEEISNYVLFLSMEAADGGLNDILYDLDEDEFEESNEDHSIYPDSAKRFWDLVIDNLDRLGDDADNNSEISSTVYGWIESGCPSVV